MNQIVDDKNHFSTSDIALCAGLCSYGYTVEAIDKHNLSKIHFLIKRDKSLDEVIQRYFSNQLMVDAMSYFNVLKAIKTRMYHLN